MIAVGLLLAAPAAAGIVSGKVTAVRGGTVTVRLAARTAVAAGDTVALSFTTPDGDVVPVGTWRAVASGTGDTLEAQPVESYGEAQVGLDAVVSATGTEPSGHGGPGAGEPRVAATAASVDDRFDLAFRLYEGRTVAKDEPRAVALLREGAQEGHPASMRAYGWLFEQGASGIAPDLGEALAWYRKAEQGGDANASFLIGLLYANGRGVPRDVGRALDHYERACAGGFASGCHNLAWHHYTGTGVPKDLAEARAAYGRSCDLAHADSCGTLGWMYSTGEGIAADRSRGIELLRKSCSLGSAWGCEMLEKAGG